MNWRDVASVVNTCMSLEPALLVGMIQDLDLCLQQGPTKPPFASTSFHWQQ
jgi:hypothetical protein